MALFDAPDTPPDDGNDAPLKVAAANMWLRRKSAKRQGCWFKVESPRASVSGRMFPGCSVGAALMLAKERWL